LWTGLSLTWLFNGFTCQLFRAVILGRSDWRKWDFLRWRRTERLIRLLVCLCCRWLVGYLLGLVRNFVGSGIFSLAWVVKLAVLAVLIVTLIFRLHIGAIGSFDCLHLFVYQVEGLLFDFDFTMNLPQYHPRLFLCEGKRATSLFLVRSKENTIPRSLEWCMLWTFDLNLLTNFPLGRDFLLGTIFCWKVWAFSFGSLGGLGGWWVLRSVDFVGEHCFDFSCFNLFRGFNLEDIIN